MGAIRMCFSQCPQKKPLLESLFNKVAGLKACNFIQKRYSNTCAFL